MAKKYNCVKNGVPYFRKTKVIGHKLDGTPIKKEFYGDGEKDCDKQIEEFLELQKRNLIGLEKITVGMELDYWLYEVKRMEIRPSSFDKYECTYRNHLKDADFCTLQLVSITSEPIQKYYNERFENGISANNIKEANKVLKMFFSWCTEQEYIKKNPVASKRIKLPNSPEKLKESDEDEEIQIFNDAQIKQLVRTATEIDKMEHEIDMIALLALGTRFARRRDFRIRRPIPRLERQA